MVGHVIGSVVVVALVLAALAALRRWAGRHREA